MRKLWRAITAYLATQTHRFGAARVLYSQGTNTMTEAEVARIAGVGLNEEVLYRLQSTGEWMRGKVTDVSAKNGELRIALMDGTVAVEVPHGFGAHEWCTLDELVEHRKVANA